MYFLRMVPLSLLLINTGATFPIFASFPDSTPQLLHRAIKAGGVEPGNEVILAQSLFQALLPSFYHTGVHVRKVKPGNEASGCKRQ